MTFLSFDPRSMGRGPKIFFIVVVTLIGARIALPYAMKRYVNWVLQTKIDGYTGSIGDFDVSLWRGAYQIQALELLKVEHETPGPFIAIDEIDFAIAWAPLLRGHVVGKVEIIEGRMNFVAGPTAAESQSGTEGKGWQDAIDSLFPLDIEEFSMVRSQIHFINDHAKPKIDLSLTELDLQATNLGNSQGKGEDLVSDLNATAKIQGSGDLVLRSRINILKKPVAFDGNLSITKLEIPTFNDFFKTYGKFNVKTGRLDLFAEAASIDGKLKGYIKPFMTNVDVLQLGEKIDSVLNLGSELTVSTVNLLIRRFSKDQLAAKVPFEGTLNDPKISIWSTIKTLLGHAFGDAIKPKVDQEIDIKKVKK